jgi:hypothetical protein
VNKDPLSHTQSPQWRKSKFKKGFMAIMEDIIEFFVPWHILEKKLCIAVQRTQLWMQENLEIKSQRLKIMKKNTLPARDIT